MTTNGMGLTTKKKKCQACKKMVRFELDQYGEVIISTHPADVGGPCAGSGSAAIPVRGSK